MRAAAPARTDRARVRVLFSPRLAWLAMIVLIGGCVPRPFADAPPRGRVDMLAVDQAAAGQAISLYRRSHGAGPVDVDPLLASVAQRQADAMAGANDLSHTVEGNLPDRLAAGGADRPAAVENVSAGYDTLDAALMGWRHSPAHNANLLFGPMRRVGIAAAKAPDTRFKTFWALVMTN